MTRAYRIFAICTAALLASTSAFAATGFGITLLGGTNLGTQTVNPSSLTMATGAGVSGGLQLAYGFLPWLGVETGAFFAMRVTAFENTIGGIRNSGTTAYPNLVFPLDVRFTIFIEGLHARTGAYFGAGIGQISTTTWTQTTPGTTSATDFATAQKSPFDVGLLEGVSYRYAIGSSGFGVDGDIRYLFGLINLDQTGSTYQAYRDIQIQAGIDFQF